MIISLFWAKHKKILLVALAAMVLLALYFFKSGLPWSGTEIFERAGILSYEEALIQDIVSKDTDGDGVLDWEETLWGLDPAKTETIPCTPDITAVESLRAQADSGATASGENGSPTGEVSATDKFSRELFSTITSLTQSGALDQATLDKISSSLAEQVQNSPQRKVYALADLKITSDSSTATYQKLNAGLEAIDKKYPVSGNVTNILQNFLEDESTVNPKAIADLDKVIAGLKGRMNEVLKLSVPQALSTPFLSFVNNGEKLIELLEDIKMFETDPIITLGATIRYTQTASDFEAATFALTQAISLKLKPGQ